MLEAENPTEFQSADRQAGQARWKALAKAVMARE